jgi:hypothetical protein
MLRGLTVIVSCLVSAGAGCSRAPEPGSTGEQSAPTASAPAPVPLTSSSGQPFRFEAAGRIVAIGDLHGDLASTRQALRLASAIDENDHWIGGNLTLVQTGDQLDRGDQEREILDLLERLTEEAAKAGGRVHVLNGNHEIMNVAADLRYVTDGGLRQFQDFSESVALHPGLERVPESARGRVLAFRPGKAYARRLASRDVAVVVSGTVFSHAGVKLEHARYGLGRLNAEVSRWMRGETKEPPALITEQDSPVWTREYGELVTPEICTRVEAVLRELGAKRMVVGHTVQKNGVSSACSGKLFRIDVGLSDYYGASNPTQVLEIEGDRTAILDAPRKPAP